VTIGSYPKKKKRVQSVSGLDTFQDDSDSKYIILEERSFQTEEVRDEDLAAKTMEKARQTKVSGW